MTLPRVSALLLVLAVVLTGCAPEPEPSPTPTSAFASEEEAFAAAEEVYRAYLDASNAVKFQEPKTFEAVYKYTAGDYNKDERAQYSEARAEGHERSGAVIIKHFSGTSYNGIEVVARVCDDVSNTDIVDAEGNSLVAVDRPDTYSLDITFTQIDDGLYITDTVAVQDDAKCAG